MDIYDKSLQEHGVWHGKIEMRSKVKVNTKDSLSVAYTPGVAKPCLEIEKNPELAYKYTQKHNLVAVVSDGSAVLGLGNIGGIASLPVMEGKAVLFKEFGNVDAVPIILATQNADEIVNTIINIAPGFGGINLEDISAPRCFEIEDRLKKALDIPVFHDDQHGTAIVVLAGVINSLKAVNKKIEDIVVVINGAGAAGCSVAKLLLRSGVKDIILCDSKGIVNLSNASNQFKHDMAEITNKKNISGLLKDALKGADVFVGVSVANVVTEEMVKSMKSNAIIFALANPNPEISPEKAFNAGAKIVATGRSDLPNQINNVLAFPGVFRGALDCGAKKITEEMKIAAAHAIAGLVSSEDLMNGIIVPDPFDKRVAEIVGKAVAKKAIEEKIVR